MSKDKRPAVFQNRHSEASLVLGRAPTASRNGHEQPPSLVEWEPLVDITGDEHEFLILVEVFEVKKEMLKVVIENGALIISGERNFVMEEEYLKYGRINLVQDLFAVTFLLPDHTDVVKVKAEFKHGLLEVRLPKKEDIKPARIEVLIS